MEYDAQGSDMLIGAKLAKNGQKSCEQIANFKIAGVSVGERAVLKGILGEKKCKYCVNKKG